MNEQDNLAKELKINRILLIVLISIVVFFFASFGFICYKTYSYAASLKPIAEELKKVDFAKIQEMTEELEGLSEIDTQKISEALESLDTEALKNLDFEGLEELINSVDVDEIKDAMEALNEAAKNLQEVSDAIAPIINVFR